MKTVRIKLFILLGAIIIAGIFSIQYYWINRTFGIADKQFDQNVQTILSNIPSSKFDLSDKNIFLKELDKVSSNHYTIKLTGTIDTNFFTNHLRQEFSKNHINTNVSVGYYSQENNFLYGSIFNSGKLKNTEIIQRQIIHTTNPILVNIVFPDKYLSLSSEINVWIFTTFLTFLFTFFIGYFLFILVKQKQLAEIQKQFVNNMTHELRTPITTILLASQTTLQHSMVEVLPELKKFLNIISIEAERLKVHTNEVLKMAKLNSSTIQLSKQKLDIHLLIREVIDQQILNNHPKIKLDFIEEAMLPIVYADKIHLKNSIANIIDNAIKYSPDESIVEIKTENISGKLLLSVKDNGIGIPKKYIKYLGQPFFRVPNGNIHKISGYGIGLNYVYKIAKAHNWKLIINTKENSGSNFQLQLGHP